MLFTYGECETKFGTHYQIKKAVQNGVLYKIAEGIYSDKEHVSEIEVISFKYPRGVFTMNSAFYYHGLTDVIPVKYYLATPKGAYRIRDTRVKQIFTPDEKFSIGISSMEYQGVPIQIYDRERMLIELIRSSKSLPFDYYKEIIESYRRAVHDLDIQKLQDHIALYPKGDSIMESIELEVL